MSNAFTARVFKPASPVESTGNLVVSLFKATPLYIFATALKSTFPTKR